MKDITNDLKERIDELLAMRAQLQRQLDALTEREDMLRSMLEYERMRWPEQPALPGLDKTNGHRLWTPLSRFIVDALGSYGPQSVDELKRRALDRGHDFKGKNPARVLNFALVGMAQNRIVKKLETGKWKLMHPADESGQLGQANS